MPDDLKEATIDELAFAIEFALKHKVLGLKWKRGYEDEFAVKQAAKAIAEHLRLANFKIFNGPPVPVALGASERT